MPVQFPASRLLEVDAQRVCVIKPSALGDVVQSLPVLGALRRRFPRASLAWVVNDDLAPLLDGHPELNEVLPFDRRGSWGGMWRLLKDLRERKFDLVVDLQGLLRTGLMTAATRAETRVGLATAREGAHLAYNCVIHHTGRDVPAHARYWRVAEMLGLPDLPRVPVVPIREADRSWAADRLWGLPRPILAVHPGARWETKRWPAEKFAEVAHRFALRPHERALNPTVVSLDSGGSEAPRNGALTGSVVVVGGTSDFASAAKIVDSVARSGGKAVNLAGGTTLKQLAALLASVDVLLSNDSGPMHLAAAVDTPVVGVFTCTSPLLSGPPGRQHELVSTAVPCAGSYHKTCPHHGAGHLACLQDVDVERVWTALLRVIERRLSGARPA